MERGKKLVLLSHCVLNQNSVVVPLGRSRGAYPIIKVLLEEGIGMIQLPCPEVKLLGVNRKPMTKEEYDTPLFRELCRKLFDSTLKDIKEYINNGYTISCIIGINHSPTCSITGERGIFMEEIFKIFEDENIETRYFEVPTDYTEKEQDEELHEKLRDLLRKA